MILGTLVLIAVALTCTMFATRQAMLGFACALFWIIVGAQSYILSATPWGDIYYYLFFASFGMTIFTALAAFGLREKRDTIADEEMETGKGEGEHSEYVDEVEDPFESKEAVEPSDRTKGIRERAKRRRTG